MPLSVEAIKGQWRIPARPTRASSVPPCLARGPGHRPRGRCTYAAAVPSLLSTLPGSSHSGRHRRARRVPDFDRVSATVKCDKDDWMPIIVAGRTGRHATYASAHKQRKMGKGWTPCVSRQQGTNSTLPGRVVPLLNKEWQGHTKRARIMPLSRRWATFAAVTRLLRALHGVVDAAAQVRGSRALIGSTER